MLTRIPVLLPVTFMQLRQLIPQQHGVQLLPQLLLSTEPLTEEPTGHRFSHKPADLLTESLLLMRIPALLTVTQYQQDGLYGEPLTAERPGIQQDYTSRRQAVKQDGTMLWYIKALISGSVQTIPKSIIPQIQGQAGLPA